jgi:hypothetical protein
MWYGVALLEKNKNLNRVDKFVCSTNACEVLTKLCAILKTSLSESLCYSFLAIELDCAFLDLFLL